MSSIDFKGGRGSSEVDLWWYPREYFLKLSKDQIDELSDWLSTNEGMKQKKLNFDSYKSKKGGPEAQSLQQSWWWQLETQISQSNHDR